MLCRANRFELPFKNKPLSKAWSYKLPPSTVLWEVCWPPSYREDGRSAKRKPGRPKRVCWWGHRFYSSESSGVFTLRALTLAAPLERRAGTLLKCRLAETHPSRRETRKGQLQSAGKSVSKSINKTREYDSECGRQEKTSRRQNT